MRDEANREDYERRDRHETHDLKEISRELREIRSVLAEILRIVKPKASRSGTTTFFNRATGEFMANPVTVHISDAPLLTVAQEWDGPNGTGNKNPAEGNITFSSDNPAAVTVNAQTGQLAYVAAGVANISWVDDANKITSSGTVTVVNNPSVSGTTDFVSPPAKA
jgi:hypothetical protein